MTSINLRYFAAVARRGSIREAAEELHVAQSALSRQIQKLEQDFGVPLFQRHARGVELTSAGEIFLRHARSSLRQTERVRSELDALKGLRRGTINIQSIESLVPGVLPQAIMRFRARHPGITFEVTVDRTDHIIAAVREGRTDIGLAFYPRVERDLTTATEITPHKYAVLRTDVVSPPNDEAYDGAMKELIRGLSGVEVVAFFSSYGDGSYRYLFLSDAPIKVRRLRGLADTHDVAARF